VGTEDSGVILILFYYKCYIYIKFCLSIYGVFLFYFGGIFEFIYFKKYHSYYVNYAYFYVLFF